MKSKRFAKRVLGLFLTLLMISGSFVLSFAEESDISAEEERLNEILGDFHDMMYGARYYGVCNGYDIVFIDDGQPAFTVITDEVIAGYTFTFSDSHGPDCFYAYRDGSFITVKDAYSCGYFSRNDIAAIYEMFWGLDKVKTDYIEYLKNGSPDDDYIQSLGAEDIVIEKEYGRYNGYYVLFIRPETVFGDQITLSLEIGEYTFEFPSTDDVKYFLAYKDGEFIPVKEAYDAHYLTAHSLADIHEGHIGDRIRREFADHCAVSYGRKVDYKDIRFTELGEYNGYRAFRMSFMTEDGSLIPSDYVEPIAGCDFICSGSMPHYGITLYKDGKFTSLADAYGTFLVSARDVERIFMKDVGNTLYERLSQSYIAYLNEQYPEDDYYQSLTSDDIVIDRYLGHYGSGVDCQILLIYPEDKVMTDDILELEIAGYTFTLPSGSMIDHFLVYKDGKFARVKDAYESGMISEEWVGECYGNYFAEKEWNNPFTDVREESWYYDSVKYVNQKGLFVGVADNTFAPGTTMTKNMFITVLWSYTHKPILSSVYGIGVFPMAGESIRVDAWYYEPLRWAAINGMINNKVYINGVPIFRWEIVQILYKYHRLTDPDAHALSNEEIDGILSVYPDKNLDRESYELRAAAAWAVKNGLIVGIPQGDEVYLSLSSTATRAQVATIIKNFTLKF